MPCLRDGGFHVRESIAIAEYLAEGHPEMWPADARARCVSAEMHAGFVVLGTAMPMNLKLRLRGRPDGVGAYRGWVSVYFPSGRGVLPEATLSDSCTQQEAEFNVAANRQTTAGTASCGLSG